MKTKKGGRVRVAEFMAFMELEGGYTAEKAADVVVSGLELSDAELAIALDTVAGLRDAKLKERSALNLPPCVVLAGEPLPGPKTLDGQILRIGALLSRLENDYFRRALNREYAAEYRELGLGSMQELNELVRLLS